jgi:hypothetical protein
LSPHQFRKLYRFEKKLISIIFKEEHLMQTQKYCKSCDKEILAISEENKNKVNHVLHLLLTIVTVFIPIPFPGWWAIVWVFLGFISMITPTCWRCSVCGGLAQLDKDTSKLFTEIKNGLLSC